MDPEPGGRKTHHMDHADPAPDSDPQHWLFELLFALFIIPFYSTYGTVLLTIQIPDVVLVKKHYVDKALRNRKRKWKLKHMEGFPHMDTESCNDEFQDFAVSICIQDCESGSDSLLDPDSIRSVDPDPDPYSESGSGSRRAKMTHKSKKKLRNFMF
jgi:hypothetical protein